VSAGTVWKLGFFNSYVVLIVSIVVPNVPKVPQENEITMEEEKMNVTTRWSRSNNGGSGQYVLEHVFHDNNGFPSATERSSLACLMRESECRVHAWFQRQQEFGIYTGDTKTITSLGMNTILLLCIYTRLRPDVSYDSMARHVSNILSTAGDQTDVLVRHHTYTFIVQEARRIRSETVDEHEAVYIAATGLIARVAGVIGVNAF